MFKFLKSGVLSLLIASASLVASAQKKLTEGEIQLSSEYHPTAEQAAMVSMLPTSTTLKFKGNMMKFEIQNGPATVSIIQDFVNLGSLTLIDIPIIQKQYAIETSKQSIQEEMDKLPKYVNFKATGEKSVIAGYNAEKYTYQDAAGNNFELWSTLDVELPQGIWGPQFKDVKGSMVKFSTTTQEIKVTQTIKSIKEAKVSEMNLKVPSGYEITTMEEILAMSGQ